MGKLVLHPTEISQWHALVSEAEHAVSHKLEEEIESYLVFLLLRLTQCNQLPANALAIEFFQGIQIGHREGEEYLKNVGDKCLLFSGLFPGCAEKRHVRISYFIKLGQSAYAMLSNNKALHLSRLYETLYLQFVTLMEVLHAMREITSEETWTVLQAQEIWSDTKSPHALQVLTRYTSGIVVEGHFPKRRH